MWTARDRERYKEDGRRYPSDLSEAEWDLIRPLVATYRTLTRDLREMVNGCLYLAVEGSAAGGLCRKISAPGRPCAATGTASIGMGSGADAAALLTPAARARLGKNPKLSTGIVDAQSVVSYGIRLMHSVVCCVR